MTYTQAIQVRTLQLSGVPMLDSVLNEAMGIIRNTRTPTAWPDGGKRADGFGPYAPEQRARMVPEDKTKPVFWCGNCGARNQ